jgi:hypothetical protein
VVSTPEPGRPDDRTVIVPTSPTPPPPPHRPGYPPTAQYPPAAGYGGPQAPYNPYGDQYPPAQSFPAADQYPHGYPAPARPGRSGGLVVALLLLVLSTLPFLGGAALVLVGGATLQSMLPADQLAEFQQLTGVNPITVVYVFGVVLGAVALLYLLLALLAFARKNWARIVLTIMTIVFVLFTGAAVFAGLAGGAAVDPTLTGGGQLVAGLAVVAAPALFALIGTILLYTPGANRFFAAHR